MVKFHGRKRVMFLTQFHNPPWNLTILAKIEQDTARLSNPAKRKAPQNKKKAGYK
jgi:hypothetical protein